LCLIQPSWVKGCFHQDLQSGDLDARLTCGLHQRSYRGSRDKGGLAVTDLKWRALGRAWLGEKGGRADFEAADLRNRFGIKEIYLVVGLTRSFQGSFWPIIVGVHTTPDYEAPIDYGNL
jgi:hypothetical protein